MSTKFRTLNAQASAIEGVLEAHKVAAKVWGGNAGTALIKFHLVVAPETKLSRVMGLQEELALSLGVPVVTVRRQNDVVVLEVPTGRTLEEISAEDMAAILPEVPPMTALLGRTAEGKTLLLDLSSPNVVHVLVVGRTGSGKTVLLNTLAGSLTDHNDSANMKLLLLDTKGGHNLSGLAKQSHTLGQQVFTTPAECEQQLASAVTTMIERDKAQRNSPKIIIVIDELADLIMQTPQVSELLVRIAQRGREAGIHLVVGTQLPTAAVTTTILRANLPTRLVGSVGTAEESKIATGRAGLNAHHLQGRGDFIIVGPTAPTRFQVAPRKG